FAQFKGHRSQAVVVYGSSLTYIHRKTIGDLVIANRLPSICLDADLMSFGHLMSYGWSRPANAQLAAEFVDKILRGAKAGGIPFQHRSPFQLIVSLKRARALSLTIPPSVLLRADQVIE